MWSEELKSWPHFTRWSKAAIITCGGLSFRINAVFILYYKVKDFYGTQFGFEGINEYK